MVLLVVSQVRLVTLKQMGLPMPTVLAAAGLFAKAFGSFSLVTGKYEKYGIPILMLFVVIVLAVFNNPFQDPSKSGWHSPYLVYLVVYY